MELFLYFVIVRLCECIGKIASDLEESYTEKRAHAELLLE